jgi:hypothetical protein
MYFFNPICLSFNSQQGHPPLSSLSGSVPEFSSVFILPQQLESPCASIGTSYLHYTGQLRAQLMGAPMNHNLSQNLSLSLCSVSLSSLSLSVSFFLFFLCIVSGFLIFSYLEYFLFIIYLRVQYSRAGQSMFFLQVSNIRY